MNVLNVNDHMSFSINFLAKLTHSGFAYGMGRPFVAKLNC